MKKAFTLIELIFAIIIVTVIVIITCLVIKSRNQSAMAPHVTAYVAGIQERAS